MNDLDVTVSEDQKIVRGDQESLGTFFWATDQVIQYIALLHRHFAVKCCCKTVIIYK